MIADAFDFMASNSLSLLSLTVSGFVAIALSVVAASSNRKSAERRNWYELVVPKLAEFITLNERIISREGDLWILREQGDHAGAVKMEAEITELHFQLRERQHAIELMVDQGQRWNAQLIQALSNVRSTSYLNDSTRLVTPGRASQQLSVARDPTPIYDAARTIVRHVR